MKEEAVEVAIEVAKNAQPDLVLIVLIAISVMATVYGLLIMKYPDKFNFIGGSNKCDNCSNKVIAESAIPHMETQNELLEENRTTINRLEFKIDNHTEIFNGMITAVEKINNSLSGLNAKIDINTQILLKRD